MFSVVKFGVDVAAYSLAGIIGATVAVKIAKKIDPTIDRTLDVAVEAAVRTAAAVAAVVSAATRMCQSRTAQADEPADTATAA